MPKHIINLRSIGHANIWNFVKTINTFKIDKNNKIDKNTVINLLMTQKSQQICDTYTKSVEQLGLNLNCFLPEQWNFNQGSIQMHAGNNASANLQIIHGLAQNDLELFCTDNANTNMLNAANIDSNPCNILGDLSLIYSLTPELDKIRISWIGGATPLANALVEASIFLPFELFMAVPRGEEPNKDLVAFALTAGAKIFLTRDVNIAADSANYVYLGNVSQQNKNTSDSIQKTIQENVLKDAKTLLGFDNLNPDQIDQSWLDFQTCLYQEQSVNTIKAQTYILSWLLSE